MPSCLTPRISFRNVQRADDGYRSGLFTWGDGFSANIVAVRFSPATLRQLLSRLTCALRGYWNAPSVSWPSPSNKSMRRCWKARPSSMNCPRPSLGQDRLPEDLITSGPRRGRSARRSWVARALRVSRAAKHHARSGLLSQGVKVFEVTWIRLRGAGGVHDRHRRPP